MKVLGWIGKVVVSAVVASCISVFTTWYVVHAYVQELLKPFHVALPENKFELSEFVVNLWSQANILGIGGKPQERKERATEPKPSETGQPPEEAVPAWSQTNAEAAISAKDQVVMSEEQFQQKRGMLSNEEKTTVFTLLISRLPEEELQRISTMVEDGITSEELAEMEKIVEKYLKPEEYKQLMQIVNKYG